MKKMVTLIMCMLLVLSAAIGGIAETAFEPGTYTGSARGAYSTIKVEVTLDEKAITDIKVTEQGDTHHIAQAAVEEMPAKIIAAQTTEVDITAGATLTGFGIKNAVRDALKTANALDAFSAKKETEITEGEEESYDLVIVGGGGSGLSAAAFARQAGVEKVLVLEKLAYTGGSTALCGGGMVVGGSKYNAEAGWDFTAQEFLDYYKTTAQGQERPNDVWINEALVYKVGEKTGNTYDILMDAGLPMETFAYPSQQWAEGRGLPMFWRTSDGGPKSAAVMFHDFLTQYAMDNGAEIRLNSEVTELITDNGAVVGVKVQDTEKKYDVKAKKVILACGGMEANAELVAKYSPEAKGSVPYACPGNTGDFLHLTEELNAALTGYGSVPMPGLDSVMGFHTPYGAVSMGGFQVWVNQEGERFTDENDLYYLKGLELVKQTGAKVWGVADANNASVDTLEAAVADGYAYKAETLAELAEKIKVPADVLAKTIETYNADAASGNGDTVFGTPAEMMAPVQEGPFYAQPIRTTLLFTLTSLKVDDQCRVLNESGSVIENLYAAGEAAMGNLFFESYIGSGSAVQNAIVTGRIAAEDAAAQMK